jgi:hypothetical protein
VTTLGPKDPDVDTEYGIDARYLAYQEIRRSWPYGLGTVGRAPRHTGFYYEATTAGETKQHWPDFPREAGGTVEDGSVVWTAKHPNDVSLPSIASVSWAVSPSGLTVGSERLDGGIVYPTLEDGVDGVDYEVTAHLTWSNGQQDDITVTIPVRAQ